MRTRRARQAQPEPIVGACPECGGQRVAHEQHSRRMVGPVVTTIIKCMECPHEERRAHLQGR